MSARCSIRTPALGSACAPSSYNVSMLSLARAPTVRVYKAKAANASWTSCECRCTSLVCLAHQDRPFVRWLLRPSLMMMMCCVLYFILKVYDTKFQSIGGVRSSRAFVATLALRTAAGWPTDRPSTTARLGAPVQFVSEWCVRSLARSIRFVHFCAAAIII